MKPVWKPKSSPKPEITELLQESIGIPPLVAHLLAQRGIESFEQARDFFNPDLNNLHDPFLMKDMDRAVHRIQNAISAGEKIMVFGDYDVDGTTSVALMYSFVQQLLPESIFYIPDRYTEGYGISKQGIDHAHTEGCGLIIALDCGIRSVELVGYAKSKEIDFIICDHHLPGSSLPGAVAVLDPKRPDCEYPYKELSGCGVGFKLLQGLFQILDKEVEELFEYLDLVAVSIASDIVPITGENRILAFHGMKCLNETPRVPMKAVKAAIGSPELSISNVVFFLGPRINAAGRMKHAHEAVQFLMSKDEVEAATRLESLNKLNVSRREVDASITESIFQELPQMSHQFSLVFSNANWHKGVIGIVASRVVEEAYKPTVVFTENDGLLTGSARSIQNFDIHAAFEACSEHIEQFGGHMYAAGLTIKKEKLADFKMALENYCRSKLNEDDLQPVLEYDYHAQAGEVTEKTYRIFKRMAPFGPGNPNPILRVDGLMDTGYGKLIGQQSDHLKLNVRLGSNQILTALGFGMGKELEKIKAGPFDACFYLEENFFRGVSSLQMHLKDIQPTD
jgi:single-stranded-DNA-specific exonuclease